MTVEKESARRYVLPSDRLIMTVADAVDPKAARCLFDETLIRSRYDLEKMTGRGRQTKIKLNIDPPPYGRCCVNRFDPVC